MSEPNVNIFNFFFLAKFSNLLKNLHSLFKIIVPFLVIFLIISDFAFAIFTILPSLPKCASPIFVMIPRFGFNIFDK